LSKKYYARAEISSPSYLQIVQSGLKKSFDYVNFVSVLPEYLYAHFDDGVLA
jgi:hypothetical protein